MSDNEEYSQNEVSPNVPEDLTDYNENDSGVVETNGKKKIPFWVWLIIVFLGIGLIVMGVLYFNRPPVEEDLSWINVQNAGVLKVATSADYRPFSYINGDNMIDGLDPALIKEIGNRLGVQVEITNYAFDGLGAALQVGQVDAVISAISITPERAAIAEFSNVYYVGLDGVLARTDSDIESIEDISQFAGKRVGVQRSSIYHTWAQQNLVDSGIISEDMFFFYTKPEDAVSDLKLGRLDVVVMDYQPAIQNLTDPEISLVGQGFNQQKFAIALPKDAYALKAKIDQALLALQNEGVVNQLALTYLGLTPEDLIPVPTPEPTEDVCVNAMIFIEDLSYDDNDLTDFPVLEPGEAFQKGWRIQNTGTCDWTVEFFITYVDGNDPDSPMGGQPTAISETVSPEGIYDMYVDLVAPMDPGKYVGYWQMHDANGEAFGQSVWVAIEVGGSETEEPAPTDTPEATATPEITPTPTATEVVTEVPGSDLLDVTWVLEELREELDNDDLIEVIPDVDVTIEFDDKGRFSVFAGCNTVNGRYVTDGVQILFKDFTITNMYCDDPEGIMEQEVLLQDWLERAEEYEINDDDELFFYMIVIENDERVEKTLLQFIDVEEQ